MSPLYAKLNRWQRVTYQWGENDCVTLCADWILRMRGVDPAADVRLTYESAAECQRVTRFFTDPVGAVGPCLDRAGLARTGQPRPGDVGVILLLTERGVARPHMALCLGRTWALKDQSGAVNAVVPLKIAAAWEVGYEAP